MENTSPLLFEDDTEKYFLAIGGKAIGPLTAQNIYERIQRSEATLLDFIWQKNWSDWKRILEEKEFAVLLPTKPSSQAITQIKKSLAKKVEEKKAKLQKEQLKNLSENFYLYTNQTQYGPFKKNEVAHLIEKQKLSSETFIWTEGLAQWTPLNEFEPFAQFVQKQMPPTPKTSIKKDTTKSSSKNKRSAPRRPLVARLFLHNNEDIVIAVCRDISVGGMQVLTDRVPGKVGSTIKLNVSPAESGQSQKDKVKSFVAEGQIVRILEDGRGFSFRFSKISDETKQAIEKYIQSA